MRGEVVGGGGGGGGWGRFSPHQALRRGEAPLLKSQPSHHSFLSTLAECLLWEHIPLSLPSLSSLFLIPMTFSNLILLMHHLLLLSFISLPTKPATRAPTTGARTVVLSMELTPQESLKTCIVWRIVWKQRTADPLPFRSLETSPLHLAFNVLILC